jgi:hypothetical protein
MGHGACEEELVMHGAVRRHVLEVQLRRAQKRQPAVPESHLAMGYPKQAVCYGLRVLLNRSTRAAPYQTVVAHPSYRTVFDVVGL